MTPVGLALCALVLGAPGALAQEDGARALRVAAEVERLAEEQTLWPGFDPMAVPLAIYDGERTYLFRHPATPEGFTPAAGDEGLQVFQGRHPAVTANTSTGLGGATTATLMIDRTDPDRGDTDLAAVALHETFHVYQREHHSGWSGNEADLFTYPTDDVELLALRRLEMEALRRALDAGADAESACWARVALVARGQRYAAMNETFAAYERGTELNEGLANYVELRAAGRSSPDVPADGYGPTDVRRRAYTTGSALALLLDRFEPGWPASFERDDTQHLDVALGAALEGTPAEACRFEDGEVTEAARAARADVAAVAAHQQERRAAFESRPGWRVVLEAPGEPLWLRGFDPLNVERLPEGVLHARFLKLGNETGELEALDGVGADVEVWTEAAGEHPLYNGVRRVVVSGLDEPRVQADGGRVRIDIPGFTAEFEGARVQPAVESDARTVVVVLGP